MTNTTNHKKSPVKMVTKYGIVQEFESISDAAKFADANSWTMAVKMQVMGYFEDKNGNKYFRKEQMKTKNKYTTSSAKVTKKMPKYIRKSHTVAVVIDGVIYKSYTEAAEAINVAKDTIASAVRNGRNTVKGHKIYTLKEWEKKQARKQTKTQEKAEIKQRVQPVVEKQQKIQSILVETDDPVIKMINERIVKTLKDAGVYEEIKKLSEAIAKLSK